jgi:hypothetical protein
MKDFLEWMINEGFFEMNDYWGIILNEWLMKDYFKRMINEGFFWKNDYSM